MYALRALVKEDMYKALKLVSDLGFEGVEFAGFAGHSAEEVAGWLKELGLEAMGAHVEGSLILDHADETIAFHKTIGNSRIIIPHYDLDSKADVLALAEKLKTVAPKYKEAGMRIYYHNHASEFRKDEDTCLIDLLAEATPADVLWLEFDAYWVYRGGQCPVAYLNKYADRVDIFHAKDGVEGRGTILSKGAVNLEGVFAFAKEHNMAWAVVESEAADDVEGQIQAVTQDYQELVQLMK